MVQIKMKSMDSGGKIRFIVEPRTYEWNINNVVLDMRALFSSKVLISCVNVAVDYWFAEKQWNLIESF